MSYTLSDLAAHTGLRVLGFHSISDLSGTSLARFGIPKVEFRDLVDTLLDHGVDFIEPQELFTADQVVRSGARVRALVTFDDCYDDIVDAFDVLRPRGIRALVFPVSSLIGSYNRWNRGPDTPRLSLLGADGLRALVDHGWVIGSHTHAHKNLTLIGNRSVRSGITRSISKLDRMGLQCSMSLAYPYGLTTLGYARLLQRHR